MFLLLLLLKQKNPAHNLPPEYSQSYALKQMYFPKVTYK